MKKMITILGLAAACAALALPASAQGYGRHGRFGGGQSGRSDGQFIRNDGQYGRNGGQAGRVRWSGTVDSTVMVVVRDGSVQTRTVNGNNVRDVRTDVQGRLPERGSDVRLRQEEGRGDVRIVEQPNARNGFTTRVRIDDPQGGSSHYAFTLAYGGGGRTF